MEKFHLRVFVSTAVVLTALLALPQSAFASRTILSATLNSSQNIVVAPSATIAASITVQTSGGDKNWKSTSWKIGSAPFICVNSDDHTSSGTHTETISIMAPGVAGKYNVEFVAYSDDICSSGGSSSLTMNNAVEVSAYPFVTRVGTFTGNTGGGTISWADPSRVTASDGDYAHVGLDNNQISHFLKGSAFGFGIPDDSTVKGIELRVERHATNDGPSGLHIGDNEVRLIKNGGAPAGDSKAAVGMWGESDETIVYGGQEDLWGQDWGASDINNATTGVALSAKHDSDTHSRTAEVDYINVTVFYVSIPSTTTSATCTNPVTYGGSTSCTATVTSGSGTPNGTVTWSTDGAGTFSPTSCTLSGGACSVSYAPSAVGTGSHAITAAYGGSSSFQSSSNFFALSVSKAAATVTLADLAQTYDGTARAVSATTTPPGLAVGFTYDAAPTAPSLVGEYAIVGTISDPNYEGSSSGTLRVSPKSITPVITAEDKQYDGTTTATVHCSLDGVVSGDTVACTAGTANFADAAVGDEKAVTATSIALTGEDAGQYALSGTTATTTANIVPAGSHIMLNRFTLNRTYDGTAKVVTAFTFPRGLDYSVSYNGVPEAPVNAGSYHVVATVTDPSYVGSTAEGTLVIHQAPQIITIGAPSSKVLGDDDFTVSVANRGLNSGNQIVLEVSPMSADVCALATDTMTVHLLGTGFCTLVAHQEGTANYLPGHETHRILVREYPWTELNGTDPMSVVRGGVYEEPGAIVHLGPHTVRPLTSEEIDASGVNTEVVGSYTVFYNAIGMFGIHAPTVTRTVNVVAQSGRRRRVHDEDGNAMQLIAMGMSPGGGTYEGGVAPTPTPSETPLPSETPVPTETPVVTESPTPTPTPSESPTPTPTETPAPTEAPVSTETPTPTPVVTETPTPTPTETPTPTPTPAQVSEETPTPSPSETPNELTAAIGNPGFFGRIWNWFRGLFY